MKKVIKIGLIVVGNILCLIIIWNFTRNISDADVFNFLKNVFLYPLLICGFTSIFTGILSTSGKACVIYGAANGFLLNLTINIFALFRVSPSTLEAMMAKTEIPEGWHINIDGGGGFGSFITGIMIFITISIAANFLGLLINKIIRGRSTAIVEN